METDILGVIAVLMVAAACLLAGWLLARIRHPCNCGRCMDRLRSDVGWAFTKGLTHGSQNAIENWEAGKPLETYKSQLETWKDDPQVRALITGE